MVSPELTYALLRIRKDYKKLKAHPGYRSEPPSVNARTHLIIALRTQFPPREVLSSKEIEQAWRHSILEALIGYSISSQNDLTYSDTSFLAEVIDGDSKYFDGKLRTELQDAIETEFAGKAWAILDNEETLLALSNLPRGNDISNTNGSSRSINPALDGTGTSEGLALSNQSSM